MKAATPTTGVVTGLATVGQDAPSSMMHGASIAVLHITPLSVMRPVQQFICPRAKGARRVFVRPADIGVNAACVWLPYASPSTDDVCSPLLRYLGVFSTQT